MVSSGSRNISFYTALIITGLYIAAFVVISVLYYQFQWLPFVLSTPVMFLFSFLIIRFALDKFIYEKIKPIYKTIGAFKEEEQGVARMKNESLEKVNRVVMAWSEKQKKEIEELKQMAVYRREFLGNVSHELKTPIFNIQGYILTLLDGGLEDKAINKTFLKKANKSINRMIAIVEDLEEISKLESGVSKLKERPFDLYELVRDIIDFMELKAKKNNARIVLESAVPIPVTVLADKKRIRQVFINLIDNAIKYGNNVETIIQIGFHDLDPKFLIEISDNGSGIKEKYLPRVFERFYRTDAGRSRDKGGTGLGLAIVKHIVEAHRQNITVRSKQGRGTTFSFTLQKSSSR